MRQIDISTLSNQNISSYLLAHTYTADADRAIFARIHLDQVAGGGDYLVYATIQPGGAGSVFMEGPITTFTVPAAQTAIGFVSILIPVNSGDVVKFYVKGLAGDTATPDLVTRIFELTYLRPTTPGRTLDVDASGGAEVGSFQAGAITAAAIATDAIDADALATDAVTEIQSGLSTLTAAQVWSYATRTLSSFGTLVADIWAYVTRTITGGGGSAADVWSWASRTLTSTAAATVAAIEGSTLAIVRYTDFAATLSGMTISASWMKMYLTIKRSKDEADASAILQIVVSNPAAGSTDGVLAVNSGTPGTGVRTQASLTVTQAAGTVAITISDELTAVLATLVKGNWYYDVKQVTASGTTQLTNGLVSIGNAVTRAIS